MNEIFRHIRLMLSEEGRVPLPGLGELSAHYVPASVDLSAHRFSPPSWRLEFGSGITDPHALAGFIASRRGSDTAAARHEVERFCASVRASLTAGETYRFPGVGLMALGRDGSILFEADQESYSRGEGLGLSPFTMTPVQVKEKEKEKVEDTVAIPDMPPLRTSVPRQGRRWLLWVLLFYLVFGGIAGYLLNEAGPGRQIIACYLPLPGRQAPLPEQPAPVLPTDTAGPEDSLGSSPVDTSATVPEDSIPARVRDELPQVPAGARFYIVAGAFRTPQGVEQTLNKLRKKGYPALVLDTTSTGLMVVCYNGYPTQEAADAALRTIRAEGDTDAWVRKARN
ncbi:MAG TPA: SPOR domain-containing protein [Bacteroidales bacterium]|nr:SPOR domain-containing protein [Bacteroidales bacterium]HRZ77883.1 SPOR domain-containing protein [Bacteroidales bacterium]